jgi:hypothetical protein
MNRKHPDAQLVARKSQSRESVPLLFPQMGNHDAGTTAPDHHERVFGCVCSSVLWPREAAIKRLVHVAVEHNVDFAPDSPTRDRFGIKRNAVWSSVFRNLAIRHWQQMMMDDKHSKRSFDITLVPAEVARSVVKLIAADKTMPLKQFGSLLKQRAVKQHYLDRKQSSQEITPTAR